MPHVPNQSRSRSSHRRITRPAHSHSGYLAPLEFSNVPQEQEQIDDIVGPGELPPGTVDGGVLIDYTIPMTKFVDNLRPPTIVDALPTLPDSTYPQGSFVFLTIDEKLYRNTDGNTWSAAVDGADIEANSIVAGKIVAGAIGAEELAAAIVLASLIKTAESGTRVEMDEHGIRAYKGDDLIFYVPTDGSDVYIDAEVLARGLTVTGDAEFRGAANVLAGGGVLTLGEGIENPVTKPGVSPGWETETFTGSEAPVFASEYTTTGGAGGATAVVYMASIWGFLEWDASTRTLLRIKDTSGVINGITGLASWGSYLYAVGTHPTTGLIRVVRFLKTTLAHDASYDAVSYPFGSARVSTLSFDGTNLVILQVDDSGYFRWNKYDSTMTKVGSTVTTTFAEIPDAWDHKTGSFDFGAWRLVAVDPVGSTAHVLDSTGTHKTDECFPVYGGYMFWWDGSIFRSGFSSTQGGSPYTLTFAKHTSWTWAAATSDTLWVGYSWYDSNATGGTHETAISPKQSLTMPRRKRILVSMPTLPGGGGTDDPNNRRVYVTHSSTEPASSAMKLQTTTASASTYISSYNSGGAAPPTSNNFPATSSAEIKSNSGSWSLKGDGTASFGGTSGDAIKIGDDGILFDANIANTVGIKGQQSGVNGRLVFGSDADTNLYRGAANTLKTDDAFQAASLALGTNKVARYVPLTTNIMLVTAGAYSSNDASVQTTAEITDLPSSGVVAVQVMVNLTATAVNNNNFVKVHNYGASVNEMAVLAYPGNGKYSASQGMVTTGGTNNRQLQYSRNWGSGTVTWYMRIVGYWTTE